MSNCEKHFMHQFFYPRSVAVVGATRNTETINYFLLANILRAGFQGKIFPVNPNATEILGLKTYPSVRSLPEIPDLVAISIPAKKTIDVVRDCAAHGVKAITIIAGGFSEAGDEGRGMQEELKHLLRTSGIRALGPNALSPVNSRNGLIIGFGPFIEMKEQGRLAFIFQSGLYQPRLNWILNEQHVCLSKLIDLGNKMDITEVDALEYLSQDPDTEVIAMHLESIAGNAQRFREIISRTTREKPVIVLKSGRTVAGALAASSHTGAIIKSTDNATDAALRQSGALRVNGLDDFWDLAKAFEHLPPMKGNRVFVSSLSGGEGVITADCCAMNGLVLADLAPDTQRKLRAIFPPWDMPFNPFDMGVATQFNGFNRVYEVMLDALSNDPNVDCIIVQAAGTFSSEADHSPEIYAEAIRRGKHLIAFAIEFKESINTIERMEALRVPVYPSVERAVRAAAALHRYHVQREAAG